jgi:hypothetical protein
VLSKLITRKRMFVFNKYRKTVSIILGTFRKMYIIRVLDKNFKYSSSNVKAQYQTILNGIHYCSSSTHNITSQIDSKKRGGTIIKIEQMQKISLYPLMMRDNKNLYKKSENSWTTLKIKRK